MNTIRLRYNIEFFTGFGETVSIAEQMAAMNTLEYYFEYTEQHHPFANTNNLQLSATA